MKRVCSLTLCLTALLTSAAEEAKTPRTDLYGDPLPPGAVLRLGTTRLRHARADVVYSKDGKQLISCGRDGEVRLWDASTGKLLRRTRLARTRAEEHFWQMRLSPDSATAANDSSEGVLLHDTTTGAKKGRLLKLSQYCRQFLTYSPDGKRLIVQSCSAGKKATPQVWDVAAVKKLCILDCSTAIELHGVAFSPNGRRVAGRDGDDKIHLWDADSGAEIHRREQRIANGRGLAFSPDGATLAVGTTAGREVHLLDADTLRDKEKPLKLPARLSSGGIIGLVFSPDGRWLAGLHLGGVDAIFEYGVILWDRKSAKEARRLPGRFEGHFAFAPDSKTLAYNDGWGSEIRVIDVASGRQLSPRSGHDTAPRILTVSSDGKTLASAAGEASLRLWDMATGKPLRRLAATDGAISVCLFAPDGRYLISANEIGIFQVWNVSDGKELRRFECFPQGALVDYHAVHLSLDGRRLQAVLSERDAKAPRAQRFFWELATGKRLKKVSYPLEQRVVQEGGENRTRTQAHAAFTPDGEIMTAWRDDRVRLEEISTGSLLATLPQGVGNPLLFSPDGRLVAATMLQRSNPPLKEDERKGVSIIETASGAEVVRLEIGAFDYAAFTPDGRGIVVADKKTLHVWDTDTGERRHEMTWPESIVDGGGAAKVCSLAVLPDGRVATGMSEGDILIWDLAPSSWPRQKAAADLNRARLAALWSNLAGDAREAHRALAALAAAPSSSVPFLSEHLQPIAEDDKRIEQLLADLDSDAFEKRETASRELTALRYRIEPRLRQALEGKPSLEMRRRLQDMLAQPKRLPTEALRTLRAIAVLERIGTPAARRILEKLSGGAATPETHAAQAALRRLKRR